MGEVTEMKMEGILCERCGAYMGEEVGHPRKCESCKFAEKNPPPAINMRALKKRHKRRIR